VSKPAGFITGNLKSYPGELEYYSAPENVNSIMVMRVMDMQSKRVQGLPVVDSENVRAFTDEHKNLLDRFTRIASAMITNTNMRIQMNRFALQAENQYEVAKSLAAALRWEDVLDAMVDSLKRTFEHDRIVICGYNPYSGKGYLWKLHGEAGTLVEGADFDVQDPRSLYGSVFRNRRAVVVQGFRQEERYVRFNQEETPAERPQDMLLAPIQDDRQSTLGIVGVESGQAGTFSQAELQIMKTIMANVSNALTKARMYQEMENQATIDGLTQVPNHRKFQDFLNGEMDRCQRYQLPLTLLLMDIDHFKKFNDPYGHPVGDLVLKSVARTLTQCLRTSDFCARYGGEEFVVVLIQADEAQARQLAERVREAVERMVVQTDGNSLQVTVSIGSATFPADGTSKQDLIDNSDKAMYYSKKNGRNRVTFFSQIRQLPAPTLAPA
jgi:diguanylate cyclase (GGDEF)-like protein